MTAADAHVILTQGAQQIAASAPGATAVAAGWITGALILITAGVLLQRWRRKRITRRVFREIDEAVAQFGRRTPTQPSPVVTHHDAAMLARWRRFEDETFVADGMVDALQKIIKEGDDA